MAYNMNVGITIFGSSLLTEWNFNEIIAEFKQFIETNSEFSLNIKTTNNLPLSNYEITYWSSEIPPCYFMYWGTLSYNNRLKIPSNVQINIVPYHYNNMNPICWTAGTWDSGLYPWIPWISQPFGYTYTPFPPWIYHATQDMVHEWIHALDALLSKLGFPEFPANHNIHDCELLGYKIENGWADCYKYYLSTITPQMYQAIEADSCRRPTCFFGLA